MGCHLRPGPWDTFEVLALPTWNLPHIEHAEVKLNMLLTFYSPRIRAERKGPEGINNRQTGTEFLIDRVRAPTG